MDEKEYQSIADVDKVSDEDLWDEFVGEFMTPEDLLAAFEDAGEKGPDEPVIAEYIACRLREIALGKIAKSEGELKGDA